MQDEILEQTISKSNKYLDKIRPQLNPNLKLELCVEIADQYFIHKKSLNQLAKIYNLSTTRIQTILKNYKTIVAPKLLAEIMKENE